MVVVVSKQMTSLPKFYFMQKKPFCFINNSGPLGGTDPNTHLVRVGTDLSLLNLTP